jgi:opacity protein-like surface antigen
MGMRHAGTYIAVSLLAGSLAVLPARAEHIGWYVKGGVGPAWADDVEVDLADDDLKFDVGMRLDIGGGYRFCDWFALEGETGFIINYIDELGGIDDWDDSYVANWPLMVNAVFEIPTRTPLVPFLGVGMGMSFTTLEIDDVGGLDGDDTAAVFAYQGFAGLRYNINDQWSVSVQYKYFATTDPEYDVGGLSEDLELQDVRTHAIVASFGFNF